MSSTRHRVRYDEYDDDDIDIGQPRQQREHPTTAGVIGFIFSAVSLGLLVVVGILYIFLKQDNQAPGHMERTRWMMYWFLLMDILSFFAALAATILGGRGIAASNPLYRGYSMTALISGIVFMVATMIFGFIMTGVVLCVEVMRAGG